MPLLSLKFPSFRAHLCMLSYRSVQQQLHKKTSLEIPLCERAKFLVSKRILNEKLQLRIKFKKNSVTSTCLCIEAKSDLNILIRN